MLPTTIPFIANTRRSLHSDLRFAILAHATVHLHGCLGPLSLKNSAVGERFFAVANWFAIIEVQFGRSDARAVI